MSTKTWDEFIARQVEAQLRGEETEVRKLRDLFYEGIANDFWASNAITSCWIFTRGRAYKEFWHVDENGRRVVRVTFNP